MARTRAQEHPDAPKPKYAPEGSKPSRPTTAKVDGQQLNVPKDRKRKPEEHGGEKAKDGQTPTSKKKTKIATPLSVEDTELESPAIDMSKLDAILSNYGVHPLQDTSLSNQNEATPEIVLSLLYLAMLTSARISHELAYKSLQCLIEAGYHDIEKLKKSTWQERTEVLTKGGYTRYREKTATTLGELADLIEKKYGALHYCMIRTLQRRRHSSFCFQRAQTTISTIYSKKQTPRPAKSEHYFKKSKASGRWVRTSSSMPLKVSGHLWHHSSIRGAWRRPSSAV